jgi:hypothetical protein
MKKFTREYDQFLNTMVEHTWVEQCVYTDIPVKEWLKDHATLKFQGPKNTGHTVSGSKLARCHEGVIVVRKKGDKDEIVEKNKNFPKRTSVMTLAEFKKEKKLPSLIVLDNASCLTEKEIQSVYEMVKEIPKRLVILQLG